MLTALTSWVLAIAAQAIVVENVETTLDQRISSDRISAFHQKLTARPHRAGTEGSRAVAEYLVASLTDAGLDVEVVEYYPHLSSPRNIAIEVLAPTPEKLTVWEPPDPRDPSSTHPELEPGFVAYSASATVTGDVVYVGYGLPADYEELGVARLAGEAGPIQHYASARAINGRAGLYPSRYQSDEVDHADGSLVRQCNRKLRGAAMLVAGNLIKCHPYYRGISALWTQQKVDPRDRRCRIANRAMRMVYQLVAGRQLWRGKGVDREYLLAKLQEFHRVHKTPVEQSIQDMHEAYAWLPKSAYGEEAKPLAELARKKHRGPKPIGELLIPLLIRLGVSIEEEKKVESTTSEARSSD